MHPTAQVASAGAETVILPLVNVTILYEDFGTGLRAKRSLDLLPAHLGAKAQLSTRLWRTQLLADPLFSEQAAREAAAADVIIISLHGQSPLSAAVRTWLDSWLHYKQPRPYALGVLLDPAQINQGGQNPVAGYLQQLAAIAGVDLFYGFSEPPGTRLDPAMEELNQRARLSSTVLNDMLKRTNPHRWWGINE